MSFRFRNATGRRRFAAAALLALLSVYGLVAPENLLPANAQSSVARDQAPGSANGSPVGSPVAPGTPDIAQVPACTGPSVAGDRIDGCLATYALRFDATRWQPGASQSAAGFEQTSLSSDPHTQAYLAAINGLAPTACTSVRIAELQATEGVVDVFTATDVPMPSSDPAATTDVVGYTVAQPDGAVFNWRELVDCRVAAAETTLRMIIITPAWAWDLMVPAFDVLLAGLTLDPDALPTSTPTRTPMPPAPATATARPTFTVTSRPTVSVTSPAAESTATSTPPPIPSGTRIALPESWTVVDTSTEAGIERIQVTNGRSSGWLIVSNDFALDANNCQQTYVNDWGMVPRTWDLSTLPGSGDAWYRYQRSETLTFGGYYLYRDGREYALFVGCLADEQGSVGLIVETPWGDADGWREDVTELLNAIQIDPAEEIFVHMRTGRV